MNQTDISQAAGRLLREYGADAEAHVRQRFYDAVSHRNVQGASVWRRILKAWPNSSAHGTCSGGAGGRIPYDECMQYRDLYRRAKRLIHEYGADAAAHARMQADLMLEHGDMEAFAQWKRLASVILEIRTLQGSTEH